MDGLITIILIGAVVGALIGNYLGEAISPDGTMHWILSVLVALALLMAYGAWTRRTSV